MEFQVNGGGTSSMTIASTGNLGIGTSSPETKLDVSGTGRITTSLTTGAVYSTNITSTNIVATNLSAGTLRISNITLGNTGNIRFNNDGSGLIWGSNYSRIYDDSQLRIFTDDQMFFHIGNTTGTAMYIGSNSNVGISNTAPTHLLSVGIAPNGTTRDISNGILCNCEEHDHDAPVDNNGNPLYYGLDYGKITPYLTKSLQETLEELELTKSELQSTQQDLLLLKQFIQSKFPGEYL